MTEKIRLPFTDYSRLISILNNIAIFAGLNEKQLYHIFTRLESVIFNPNEMIFEQGDSPSDIYIVVSGKVKIFVFDDNDEPLQIDLYREGDCFGETAVLGVQKHSASAIALEKTEIAALPRTALNAVFETDKEAFSYLILNIARETSRRLHRLDESLAHCAYGKRRFLNS